MMRLQPTSFFYETARIQEIFIIIISLILLIGNPCTLKSGASGLCKFLTDCAPALKAINKGGFPEELCSSQGTQFVVCCEDTSPVTKPPPKIETRIEIPTPKIATEVTPTKRKPGEISKKSKSGNLNSIWIELIFTECKEYASYVWDRSKSPTLSGVNHTSNTFECPFEKLPLIIGGTLASRQEFPHMVILLIFLCRYKGFIQLYVSIMHNI